MKLVNEFDTLFNRFEPYFHQNRSFQRARELAFAHLVTLGRHTISRIICAKNDQQKDWSADYKLFSRCEWSVESLFFEIIKECNSHCSWAQDAIIFVLDDTAIKKTGKKIPAVRTLRDPMSLPYHVNLMPAIRFIQASAIITPDNLIEMNRAIPVYFEEAAPAKKPRKNEPDGAKELYKKEQKKNNLSVKGHNAVIKLRQQVDQLENGKQRPVIVVVDGSYCNRNFLRQLPENIIPIARTRKDIKIFRPAQNQTLKGRRKVYGDRLPTPEQIRKDDNYAWQTAKVFGAGKYHNVRYKTLAPVLWQKGTGSMPMRLVIIAPLRYRKSKNSKLLYRKPAYILCPDLQLAVPLIIQYYFFRWDIEVNNRDEKSLLGIGDAQVRSDKSVGCQPQFSVIAASLLILASIRAYGAQRTEDYLKLPKWRKTKKRRPSMLDIIAQFRREIMIEQLQIDMEKQLQNNKKKKYRRKKPRSRIEAQKRGFDVNEKTRTTRLKLPINIISALLYADC